MSTKQYWIQSLTPPVDVSSAIATISLRWGQPKRLVREAEGMLKRMNQRLLLRKRPQFQSLQIYTWSGQVILYLWDDRIELKFGADVLDDVRRQTTIQLARELDGKINIVKT